MEIFTENQLLDLELAYKHNNDVLSLIAEVRELRLHECKKGVCSLCDEALE